MTFSSLRRSRRLQHLASEEDSLGACFICQEEFKIQQLSRLRRTACCRVLLHHRCFKEMVARTWICGNCRTVRSSEVAQTLPLNEASELENLREMLF